MAVQGGGRYTGTPRSTRRTGLIEGLDVEDKHPGLTIRLGAILTGEQPSTGAPVPAMLVRTPTRMVCPTLNLVHRGLARRISSSACMSNFSPNGGLADIVLPATTFVEQRLLHRERPHLFPVARR